MTKSSLEKFTKEIWFEKNTGQPRNSQVIPQSEIKSPNRILESYRSRNKIQDFPKSASVVELHQANHESSVEVKIENQDDLENTFNLKDLIILAMPSSEASPESSTVMKG